MTRLTQSTIQPSAERYFIFLSVSVFALAERENRNTDKREAPLVTLSLVTLSLVTRHSSLHHPDEIPACASHGRPARPLGSPCRAAPAPRTIFSASGHLSAQARRPATRPA